MSPSTDESWIGEMIQRLKHADEQRVPEFDDVLARQMRKPKRRPTRRLQLAVVGGFAATLLVALLFVRAQPDDPTFATDSRRAANVGPEQAVDRRHGPLLRQRVADINFDLLRRVVEEHCATEVTGRGSAPLWSSRTEWLLAWNMDVSFAEE